MAYTKTPVSSTQTTERMDFVYNAQTRNANAPSKDARFINVMVEAIGSPNANNGRAFVKTRPGMEEYHELAGGEPRGIYYWVVDGAGYTITVVDADVRINGVTKATLSTSTGHVGFAEHVSSVGAVTLFMADGTNGYLFTDPTLAPTLITDSNFPTPHAPYPVFLDGYMFLAKLNTQDIYNSELDLPLSWSEGGSGGGPMYISAEMYPDTINCISKNNNYILAFGQTSTEYFYDAANATGSPLARQDSAAKSYGTLSPISVAQSENSVMFVANTGAAGPTVMIIEGFKDRDIGIPAVRNELVDEGLDIYNAVGYCIRVSSQKLYILRLTDRTFVYSFETELWTEWASGATNELNFLGALGTDGPGQATMLIADGLHTALMSENYFTDVGTAIACYVTTPKYDFGSVNQKTMSRLTVVGDAPPSLVFYIAWSDNDYQTWSDWRTLSGTYGFPTIYQLGLFRRRAFKIAYTATTEVVRLDGFEVDINRGNQ